MTISIFYIHKKIENNTESIYINYVAINTHFIMTTELTTQTSTPVTTPVTTNEPIVSRTEPDLSNKSHTFLTYVNDPHGSSFETAKRIVAIKCNYTDDGSVEYGASIFRRTGDEVFTKTSRAGIRHTATQRLIKKPVKFHVDMNGFEKDDKGYVKYNASITALVRKEITVSGCCAKTVPTKTEDVVLSEGVDLETTESVITKAVLV